MFLTFNSARDVAADTDAAGGPHGLGIFPLQPAPVPQRARARVLGRTEPVRRLISRNLQ